MSITREEKKKWKVVPRQNFDNMPEGLFERISYFDTEEEAKKYVKENRYKQGNVRGRYKVRRWYYIEENKQ